jgi:transposase
VLSPGETTPVYLCTQPTDMRKSFDGLCGLVESQFDGDHRGVTGGGLFVFINRRRDRMKVLYFDSDGLAIWYKRLERGRFELPARGAGRRSLEIDARQLRLILDGIDLGSVRRRRRYSLPRERDAVTDDDRAADRATAPAGRGDRAS